MAKEKRFIEASDFYKIQSTESPVWHPGGEESAFVRMEVDKKKKGYLRSIWRAKLEWKTPRRFTHSNKQDYLPKYSPNGEQMAFISTRDGKPQIYLIPVDGGEAKALTSTTNGVKIFAWSPKGNQIAFTSGISAEERKKEDKEIKPPANELAGRILKVEEKYAAEQKDDPRIHNGLPFKQGTSFVSDKFSHIYAIDIAEGAKAKRLTKGDHDYGSLSWTADGKYIWSETTKTPKKYRNMHHDLVRVTVKGGEAKKFPRPGFNGMAPIVSPDGKWIICQMIDSKAGYGRLPRITLLKSNGKGWQDINLALDRNVSAAGGAKWSPDSLGIYFALDTNGHTGIHYYDLTKQVFSHIVKGQIAVVGFDVHTKAGFTYSAATPVRPADLYQANIQSGKSKRLSDFNKEFLAEVHVAKTQEIKYKAPDGLTIHGWIVKPSDFDEGKKWPLALNVHGGPHVMWSPSTPSMWIEWQLHAAKGYVVFACNPRGSDGYGNDYRDAIHGKWGEADLADVLTGVDTVVAKGYIDEKRMAVTGGSYGGFMTAWIIGHDQRFAAAVSQRGVYQLMSFYGTTDIPQLIEFEFDTMAFDDPEKMWKYSPFAYVRDMKTPLMILHSDSDYRVPIAGAEQLFTALTKLNRKVTFVRYPREGHELSRSGEPKHMVDRLEKMTGWFDKYCKPRKV